MPKFLEQKWITYLERYCGAWTPRQAQNAEILFYAGALALFQLTILDESSDDQHEAMLKAIGQELEEFTAKNIARGTARN